MSERPDLESLLVEVAGPVGQLTLHRPDRLNAMSRVMLAELAEAARWFDTQRDVKVVIVSGAGRAFCAGFDLNDFAEPDPSRSLRETGDLGRLMAEAVTRMRALTIAAVHGRCVGGGLVLVAACDLRVADETTVFSIPEVDLGIPLAWGGIPRLVREIGPALTKELVLTCREFGPDEAKAIRFLNHVVPPGAHAPYSEGLARQLAEKSALTLQVTKRQVEAATEALVPSGSGMVDADILVSAMHDRESREAGATYLERRRRR